LFLPETTIAAAQTVAAGAFSLSATRAGAALSFKDVPEFCRVVAILRPSTDSDIKMEVWLPAASAWNGKYMGVGNGGWAGQISYGAMGGPLGRGYAVASTDTGHSGSGPADGSFALGHPEKVIDFAWRSVHEMSVKAKAIVAAYYGSNAQYSYWQGCSTGGKQGLKEAQRFPDDYDGIIAGAPSNYWTHLVTQIVWEAQVARKNNESLLSQNKLTLLHNAVLAACDSHDKVNDGVLENPAECTFEPKALACKGADGAGCLNPAEVEAATKIYSAATNPRTGTPIYPGLVRGSELGWSQFLSGPAPVPLGISSSYFKYVVFKDGNWDYRTLDLDRDVAAADRDAETINSTDPNLKPFFERGGKLIQYHGWGDAQISPQNSINYYKSVADTLGGVKKVDDSYRLFMVPGMGHCGGGEGPNVFDGISAIEQWVEHGKAPSSITASRLTDGKIVRTHPLCPYPQEAVYKGNGSTDDVANFSCRVAK
jgi:feruloyl esterase